MARTLRFPVATRRTVLLGRVGPKPQRDTRPTNDDHRRTDEEDRAPFVWTVKTTREERTLWGGFLNGDPAGVGHEDEEAPALPE